MRSSLLGLPLFLVAGCIVGEVRDETTGGNLPNVSVLGAGKCTGTACTSSTQANTTTNSAGVFAFDPYDTTGNDILLEPADDRDTIALLMFKAGYTARVVYHDPVYETDPASGEDYSQLLPTYLTPMGQFADADGDGLSDLEESRYGTDPNLADTDGDGLSDLVETRGENWINLGDLGASPLRKDLFVECDYMPGYKPLTASMNKARDVFASAPISNPDGTTGITLHIDIDDEIAAGDADYNLDPAFDDLQVIKDQYFNPDRAPYYRYCLWTQQHSSGRSSGIAEVGGDNFIVSLDASMGEVLAESSTFVHEFGHNLGLRHGGDSPDDNYKPNYLSVMNYAFQLRGLRRDGQQDVVDFSRFTLASLNESALSEPAGLNSADGTPESEIARYETRITTGSGGGGAWTSGGAHVNVNWNRSLFGTIQQGLVSDDINGDKVRTVLTGFNDWANIEFDGIVVGSGVPGAGVSGEGPPSEIGMFASEPVEFSPETIECLVQPESCTPQEVQSLFASVGGQRPSTGQAGIGKPISACAELPSSMHRPTHPSAASAVAWRNGHTPVNIREVLDAEDQTEVVEEQNNDL